MAEKEFRRPRINDLRGRVFGKLTAIEPTSERKGNSVVWKCKCECGNVHFVSSPALLSGSTMSCGCASKGGGPGRINDLTGQKFGLLTALEPTEQRKNRSVVWKCKCDCGNIAYFSAKELRQKGKTSCGCVEKTQIKNLIGEKFGMLTVKEATDERNHHTVVWKCECDCGNMINVSSRDLIHKRKESCGCMTKHMKDLTGQKFGRLTAMETTNERDGTSVIWKCTCDCGNETRASSKDLTTGVKKSCGCVLEKRIRNLSGYKFGMLTAIRPTDQRKSGAVVWECECDCGTTVFVSSRHLVQGDTKSCGCLNDKK